MRFSIRSPGHRPFDENSSSLKIVKAAKQVFLRETDSGFSIRNVAKEADLSMGAVQHFYPTRDKLLANMKPEQWYSVIAVNLESQLAINDAWLASKSLNDQFECCLEIAQDLGIPASKERWWCEAARRSRRRRRPSSPATS